MYNRKRGGVIVRSEHHGYLSRWTYAYQYLRTVDGSFYSMSKVDLRTSRICRLRGLGIAVTAFLLLHTVLSLRTAGVSWAVPTSPSWPASTLP